MSRIRDPYLIVVTIFHSQIMPPKKGKKRSEDDDYVDENDINEYDHQISSCSGSLKSKRGRKAQETSNNRFSTYDSETFGNSNIFYDFSKSCTLKSDHQNRPIWITPSAIDNKIYLEAFHPLYQVIERIINLLIIS